MHLIVRESLIDFQIEKRVSPELETYLNLRCGHLDSRAQSLESAQPVQDPPLKIFDPEISILSCLAKKAYLHKVSIAVRFFFLKRAVFNAPLPTLFYCLK